MLEAPASLGEIAKRVDARIDELLTVEVSRWTEVDAALTEPLVVLREFVLAGGKRLRPAFCFWAFVGAGGDPDDPTVIDAGAALELLHTFALVHDDIMDNSRPPARLAHGAPPVRTPPPRRGLARRDPPLRRGRGHPDRRPGLRVRRPAVARRARPMRSTCSPNCASRSTSASTSTWSARSRATRPSRSARKICSYKSGKYTVERPLHLGAALAGRLADLRAPLSAYGDPLGEAFQLRDDLLGTFGDGAVTGKPVGEDLREGKPTTLLRAGPRGGDRCGRRAAGSSLRRGGPVRRRSGRDPGRV